MEEKKKVATRTKGVSNERPRRVARDVITALQMGEKPKIGQILANHGYAVSTQNSPTHITNSPAFKEEMDSYVTRLEKERTRVLGAMEKKTLSHVEYKDLVEANKKITHDIQLLTGGRTENRGVEEGMTMLVAIMRDIRGELPEPVPGEVIDPNYVRPEIDGEVQVSPQVI